jgi:hypothetical protein
MAAGSFFSSFFEPVRYEAVLDIDFYGQGLLQVFII